MRETLIYIDDLSVIGQIQRIRRKGSERWIESQKDRYNGGVDKT